MNSRVDGAHCEEVDSGEGEELDLEETIKIPSIRREPRIDESQLKERLKAFGNTPSTEKNASKDTKERRRRKSDRQEPKI